LACIVFVCIDDDKCRILYPCKHASTRARHNKATFVCCETRDPAAADTARMVIASNPRSIASFTASMVSGRPFQQHGITSTPWQGSNTVHIPYQKVRLQPKPQALS
jgi:hypothetical protein